MDARIKASTRLIGTSGQTGYVPQKGMLDGTAFTADWLARMALEGRMYTVNIGTGTAPIVGGGAYVNTAPDVDMSVPSGVLVVPVAINISVETWGTILLAEIIAVYGKGGVIAPTGATTQTPVNHRLDLGNDSGVTVVSDGTGATYMTPAASIVEFWRESQQLVVSKTTTSNLSATQSGGDPAVFKWSALQTGVWPIMYATDGITRLNIFVAAQAPTYFGTLTFVKPPITAE